MLGLCKEEQARIPSTRLAALSDARRNRSIAMTLKEILPRLVTDYEAGRLVPFIGAGMSRPACADWSTMVRKLEVSSRATEQRANQPLKKQDDNLPAGMIRRANAAVRRLKSRGREDYLRAMAEAVIDEGGPIPPQTMALARLWWPLVLTTNYDNYFASALAKHHKNRPFVCVGRSPEDCQRVLGSLSTAGRGIVWTLQGFLDRPEPNDGWGKSDKLEEEVVVGHEEYRRLTYRDIHFRRAFAGYSGTDRCSSWDQASGKPTCRSCSARCWSSTGLACDRTTPSCRKGRLTHSSWRHVSRSRSSSTRRIDTAELKRC